MYVPLVMISTHFAVWQELPDALRRFQRARTEITKADVEWTRSDPFSNLSMGAVKSRRSLVARDEVAYFDLGIEGITAWTEEGEAIFDPINYLRKEDQWWEFHEHHMAADLWEGAPPGEKMQDIRSLGMLPVPVLDISPDDVLLKSVGPDRAQEGTYTERRVGRVFEVERRTASNDASIIWTIDPDVGWNATECTLVLAGKTVARSVSEYQKVDGVWFPVSTTYYNGKGDVVTAVDVQAATFDPKTLPDTLTPESIGMGNGMAVIGQSGKYQGNLTIADGRPVTFEEYDELKRLGKVTSSPRLAEWSARLKEEKRIRDSLAELAEQSADPAHSPTTHPGARKPVDEWEQYTRAFILRHGLDEGQKSAAFRILRDCQERRTQLRHSRESRIASLEKAASETGAQEKKTRLAVEQRELASGEAELFYRQLKPRLASLLTRAQMQKAATTP